MKNKDVIEKTFLVAWPYAILFSIVTFIISRDFDMVLSFLLGFLTSMMLNSMNYRIMKSTFKSEPNRIKYRQLTLYFVRFIFMGLILYIAYNNENYNVYLTLVGLLSFVIVSVPLTIMTYSRGEDNDEL
jgi:cell division protein FtsW (lipid II flippase)